MSKRKTQATPLEGSGVSGDSILTGNEEVLTYTEEMENPPPAEPPWYARKAEDWELENPLMPWIQYRCRNCNAETWSRDPIKHDLCEDCGYLLRREMAEMEVRQVRGNAGRLMNPFAGMPIPVKQR